jgi:hypothetical protein
VVVVLAGGGDDDDDPALSPRPAFLQRWAQGKCKPGRAPRIKKLKASERKRAVVIVLDGEGITVLDANSQVPLASEPAPHLPSKEKRFLLPGRS